VHDLKYTEWQKPYDDAVSETDSSALAGRIRAAKVAIVSRMKEIRITSETGVEAFALENALRSLIALGYETSKIKKSQKAAGQPSQTNSQND
jgi:hypothetical protein